jgi:serine/threonine-protein kinase
MRQPSENILQGYELRRVIGNGSNGMVYLAIDTSNGQEVAVKDFPLGEASAQRFFREMSFLFTLNHPNIIRCLNLIYGKNSKSHLVLEYAPDGNLRNLVRRHPGGMESSVVLRMARQISAALVAAHAKEIIHCDVKPENILLCGKDPATAVYKLTDFGIATHRKTDSQQVSAGSPLYMAPEQFYDKPEPASDMYSLGVLLFECLSGEAPFAAADAQRLFAAHQHETPDFEKVKCPRWRHVLSRLLLKQPEARPCGVLETAALWDYVEFGLEQSNQRKPPLTSATKPRRALRRRFQGGPVPDHTLSVPTARKLCCPDSASVGELWIADQSGIDRVIYPHRKLSRQVWQGYLSAADHHHETGDLWCVISGNLQRWDSFNRRFALCGPMDAGHQAFRVWDSDHLITADASSVHCLDMTGRIQWSLPCGNYALDPCLLPLDDGTCLVSRGPAQPSVQLVDLEGRVVKQSPLPGPALAMFRAADGSGRLLAVVQSLSSGTPCVLLEADSDLQWFERATLPVGIYRAHHHTDFFTLHDLDGSVHFCSESGDIWAKHECAGRVLDDCWLPYSSLYFILAEPATGKASVLQAYFLKNQTLNPLEKASHEAVPPQENNQCPLHTIL